MKTACKYLFGAVIVLLTFGFARLSAGSGYNVDLDCEGGGPAVGQGVPSSSFGAAAGQPGYWNLAAATGPGLPLSLRDLAGNLTGATLVATGGISGGVGYNNPINHGDFRALLNDGGQILDGQITYTFSGLTPGSYWVYCYAVHPRGDVRDAYVTVPGSTSPNPQTVTGPMPGDQFIYLVTHSAHFVHVANGTLVVQVGSPLNPNNSVVDGFQIVPVPEYDLNPTSVTVFRGLQESGALADLFDSDNLYAVFLPYFTLNSSERNIQVILDGSCPTQTPTSLRLNVESAADIQNIRRWIEAWNFSTGAWVQLDNSVAATTDQAMEFELPSPADFVGPGGQVKMRISCKEAGVVLNYPWRIRLDKATWTITL